MSNHYLSKVSDEFVVLSRVSALFVFMAACTLVNNTWAQDCKECALKSPAENTGLAPSWLIKKRVNEVNVFFVAAKGTRPVADLSVGDITVLDDHKPPVAILGFRTEKELPLRIGLLVDTSDSLTSRFRFEQAAASSFLRKALSRTDDQAFVMGFSDDQKLMQDFTHDSDLLAHGLKELRVGGGTALFDAVGTSCHKLLRHTAGGEVARVLVILSDGQSNAGMLHLKDAIDMAQRAEVTVYTISTHAPVEYDTELEKEGNDNLRKLAQETGGRVLFPGSLRDIDQAFEKITNELRYRYAVSYRPADFTGDGHYREITIKARKAGKTLRVRARKGYYAEPPS